MSEACASSGATVGRKTVATSPRRRARTNRPTAWAKNNPVAVAVAYTPTARRGTSTPSETIRTATSHRSSEAANSSIRRLEPASSERTRVGVTPVSDVSTLAYARALAWSVAITNPRRRGCGDGSR